MKKLMLGLMMAFAVTAEAEWFYGGTGTESDAWNIGTTSPYKNVQAWTNGTGRLTITGTGDTIDVLTPHPWPDTIKEVVVGDGVTSIGNGAFQSCGSLTTVEMPSVTSIGNNAFYGCGSLESVAMPSVITIGSSAFYDCDSLTTVEMPSVTSINNAAFQSCGSLTTVEMPSVTSIGGSVFQLCDLLESVEMPSVTSIGNSAFMFCTKLTSITILTKDPPTLSGTTFFQVPTTCTMFIPPTAEVAVWQSTLSSAGYKGGFQKASVVAIADGKGCYTSIDVNTAIANGCKEVDFYEDCNWGLVVPDGKETTFDLCGKTLSGGLTVNGSLTVNDTSDQKTGKVTGAVSVGTNGSFTWNGNKNWTVSSATEIKNAIEANKFGAGIAVTMNGTIEGAAEIPAGQSLSVNGFTFNSPSEPVIPDDKVLVSKESIQAAKAETISIANSEIQLGVSVMSNSNITAEIANWGKVNLLSENVKVENGNVVISIPVDSASGFMILQSKDAKVGVTSGGGPAANQAVQVAGGLYLDGGAEDQVVRIDGIDTRVLGNTAEKANDNSSDE